MVDNKGLAAFLVVTRHCNFERAAAELCITQSAVSQRLKQLEENLGQTLVIRSPQIQPTRAGQALLKYAQNLQQLEHALLADLQPQAKQEWLPLAIGTNADTLATWLPDALAPWCQQNKVLLQLHVDDQDETHHLLHSGQVMGCISSMEVPAPGCQSTPLGSIEYQCIASPEYCRHYFSNGVTARSLKRSQIVRYNQKDFLQHQYLNDYYGLSADNLPQHRIPSSEGFLQWIKLGLGWGMVPRDQAESALTSGELVMISEDKPVMVPLFWHQWSISTGLIESIRQALQEAIP